MHVEQRTIRAVRLSQRQRECLESVARGHTDWATSRTLRISESTVRTHIDNALRALGAHTRAQAVAFALISGQIAFGDLRLSFRNAVSGPDSVHPEDPTRACGDDSSSITRTRRH